jgi:integrase
MFGLRSYSTRRSGRATIVSLTRFLRRHNYIVEDPGHDLPSCKADPPKPEPLPVDDVKKIIAAQPDPRDRLAILLMARLGLRKNEVRLLQYRSFHPELGYIDLKGTKGGREQRQTIGSVGIREAIEGVILEYGDDPTHYLLCARHISGLPGIKGQVFERPDHALSEGGMTNWWNTRLINADYPHTRMHRLRHTAATEFWRDTKSVAELQRFGRWKSPGVPLTYYVAADLSGVVEGIQKADETWNT